MKASPRKRPTAVLTALIMATVSAMLSTHLYTPSLPHLSSYFQTTPGVVKLSLSLNALAFGCMQIVYGPLSDRFGRRPIMLAGMVGFSLASLTCAAAQSITQLILMRIGQGVFAAAEAVLVYAIIHDYFEAGDMVRALAIYGMAVALGPASAPIIGGYMHVWLGWRANFILIALCGMFTALLIWRVLPETSPPKQSQIQIGQILHDYGKLIRNSRFMNYVIMTGTGSGFIMAMVTSGPFILISYLAVPVQYYGLFMLGPVSAYIVSNLITRHMVGRYRVDVILKTGIGISASGAVFLALMVFSDAVSLSGLIAIFSLTTFGLAPVWAIAPMKALNTTDRPTGVASAMINTIPMIMGASAALSLSVFHDNTARPLAGTIMGLLLIAVVSHLVAARHR